MTPVPFSPKTQPALAHGLPPRETGCSPESRRAMRRLAGETQKYFTVLLTLVERLDSGENAARALKPVLEEQLLRLNEKMALLATILETDSSEILRYVKRHP